MFDRIRVRTASGNGVRHQGLKAAAVGIGAASILLGASFGIAHQNPQYPQNPVIPPPQTQQNGTPNNGNQNQNNQNQNNQNQNQVKPKTVLEQTKENLAKVAPAVQPPAPLTLSLINLSPQSVGVPITFTVQVYDRASVSNTTYTYALQGNPPGSYIDPNSGDFTWTPQAPGIYSFYVWAMDNNNAARQAYELITITVNPPLQPFGYSVFFKARAVIDTRMMLLKSGLIQGVGSITNGQQSIPLTPGSPNQAPNQIGSLNTPNVFNPMGSSVFNPAANSYLYGQSNPYLQALQGQGIPQIGQQSPGLMPQANPLGNNMPGQAPLMQQPYQPPISPFGSINTLTPNNGTNGNGQQSVTGSQLQQLQQGGISSQMLQGLLGGQGGIQNQGTQSGLGGPLSSMGLGQSGLGQNNNQPGQQSPNTGLSFPSPNYQGFGSNPLGQTGLPSFSNPTGLSITPNSVFSNLQGTFSLPGPNGLPSGMPGLIANALQYLVGPQEEMGFNVYLPYPERYQLGAGDALVARIASDTMPETPYDIVVDQQGRVLLPTDTKEFVVRGLTLGQAQSLLDHRIKLLFKGGHLQLTLKALRTMSIQILGDAYQPGNYQVPAVATLFNTLLVCGGPDDNGSLRKIELRRNNGQTRTFDLYRYLTEGDMSADVPLQPGDVIFIPTITTRINIQGEVERPAIYETLPGDTLPQLLKFAGGATPVGFAQRAELDTETAGYGHVVKDVDLLGSTTPIKFYDKDTITVYAVPTDLLNDLSLKGAVRQEGLYQFKEGMRVADLVRTGGGLLPDAYTPKADLFRRNPDKTETILPVDLEKALAGDPNANLLLKAHDRLQTYHIQDVQWKGIRQVTIRGSVQKPGTYDRADGERVVDLLREAGGLTGDAFKDLAILQRTNPDGTMGPLININLNTVGTDRAMNVLLNDRDTLTVQSVQEAHYTPDETVSVLGAVQNPNQFPRGDNMRLRDALQEAGGLMPNAGQYIEIEHARVRADVPATKIRVSDLNSGDPSANVAIEAGDLITVPEDALIVLHPRKVVLLGRVAHPGAYSLSEYERLSDAITRAGGLLPDAFKGGTQFYRDPTLLRTDTQSGLTTDIVQMLQIVAQDEFTRAQAEADVEKVHLMQGGTQSTSIPVLGGTGSAAQTNTAGNVPLSIWNEQLVTVARDISKDLDASGNVNVNLAAALAHKGSFNDLELRDQDIIYVPKTPSTVSVVGAVAVPSAILYVPGHNVRYYLNRAGGPTDDAAKDRLIIVHPGGLVQRATPNTAMELGDQLLVPSKVMEAKLSDKAAEIDQISKEVTAGVVLLAILKLLIP